MRIVGAILLLCVGFAVLKAAVAIMALGLLAALVVAAVLRPAQTLGLLAAGTLLSLLNAHPLAGALVLLALAIMATTK